MTRADVDAWAEQADVPLPCADGFDDAIVGIGERFNSVFVVYDYDKVIATLVERDGMSHEDAVEWYEFNILGAWVGEGTPCFVRRQGTP
jgi:hypothetical protein